MKRLLVLAVVLLAFISIDASAKSPFNAVIVQSGQTLSVGFNNVENLLDTMTKSYLVTNFPVAYDDTAATDFTIDYRGLPVNLSYSAGTTNDLVFSIPSTGLTKTFTGSSRDASQQKLVDWFKVNGRSEVTKFMQSLVANTATDPIAGNPQSLQSRMVSNDFADGTGITSSNSTLSGTQQADGTGVPTTNDTTSDVQEAGGATANTIGFGLEYISLGSGGLSSKQLTIPLKYTVVSKSDPRRKYIFRLPISQTDIEGAKSYQVGLGLLFVLPMSEEWTLSPSFSYGLGASIDLGAAAQMLSGSLSSSYVIKKGKNSFTIGNMIGYYETKPLKYGDYNIDPDISDTVFRNGVMMSIPLGSEEIGKHAQFFVVDTRYSGTKLKVDQYNELGGAYGFSRNFRVGLTYILAPGTDNGYSINLGYKF